MVQVVTEEHWFVFSGGICGWEQWAASPCPVPRRPGQHAGPRHLQQGSQERRRASCDGAHLLYPGEHHLRGHVQLQCFLMLTSVSGSCQVQVNEKKQNKKTKEKTHQTSTKTSASIFTYKYMMI